MPVTFRVHAASVRLAAAVLLGLSGAWFVGVAPSASQTCTQTIDPVQFQIYNSSSPVNAAVNTTARVTCTGGVPRATVNVCVAPTGAAIAAGASLIFTEGRGTASLDATGAATLRIATQARLAGQITGTAKTTATFPASDFVALSWGDGTYACAAGLPARGPTSGAITFAYNDSCSTVVSANLDFGTLPITNGVGTIGVACSSGTAFQVYLSAGQNGLGTPVTRRMRTGNTYITYGIYQDAARTLPWGWTQNVDTLAGTGTGAMRYYRVHGSIVGGKGTYPPGTYTDLVSITIAY